MTTMTAGEKAAADAILKQYGFEDFGCVQTAAQVAVVQALREGRRREREAVVEDLHDRAAKTTSAAATNILLLLADGYERGYHITEAKP